VQEVAIRVKEVLEHQYDEGGRGSHTESLDNTGSVDNSIRWLCENIELVSSPNILLRLAELSMGRIHPPDYGLLHQAVVRSGEVLSRFSCSELVGLLTLCARVEFVESSFSESLQSTLTVFRLNQFSPNQLPQLVSAILRLGLDLPVDRPVIEDTVGDTPIPPSPLLCALVESILPRVSEIPEGGCLSIVHAVLRKGRFRTSPELQSLVTAILTQATLADWGLPMKIQALHAMSRLGIDNPTLLSGLLDMIRKRKNVLNRVPSANLQHLLSIIYVQARPALDVSEWQPVLHAVTERMVKVAHTMPPAILATSIGYLGRFGNSHLGWSTNSTQLSSLVRIFMTGDDSATPCISSFLRRVLSPDSSIDVSHLCGILETINSLGLGGESVQIFFLTTVRLVEKDGVHNIKATPLCQLAEILLDNPEWVAAVPVDEVMRVNSIVDSVVKEFGELSTMWSLNVDCTELSPRIDMTMHLLEGLMRHEQYVKSTGSVLDRIGRICESLERQNLWDEIPDSTRNFLGNMNNVRDRPVVTPVGNE
jgi:hypothetical protein